MSRKIFCVYVKQPKKMQKKTKKKLTRVKHELDWVYDNKHLIIKKSSIPGAGFGLFTRVSIPNNALITRYYGKLIDRTEANKLREYDLELIDKGETPVYSTHLMSPSYSGGQIIDGERDPIKLFGKGAASIANDPHLLGISEIKLNTKFKRIFTSNSEETIWLKATEDIEVNAEHPEVEIFTDYYGTSKGFEQHNIQPLKKSENTIVNYKYLPPIYTVDEECLELFLKTKMKSLMAKTWRDNIRIKKVPSTHANKYFPDEIKVGRILISTIEISKGKLVVQMPDTKELVKSSKEEMALIDEMFHDKPVELRPYGDISVSVSNNLIFVDTQIDIQRLQLSDSFWYAMNHSSHPNTKVKYDSNTKNVYWVALKDINIGEELTWNYGNVPSDWK